MIKRVFTDRNGELSTSKVWRHVAFGVATYIVIMNAKGINWELLLVYMAVVSGSEIAKQIAVNRYGVSTTISESKTATTTTIKPEGDGT